MSEAGMAEPTLLGSWADGPSRRSITDFVERVTAVGGADFVAAADRIAVFDNDGTLWTEQPMPIQLDHILHRFAAEAAADPALRERQPWKAAYERDYHWLGAAFARYYQGDDADVRVILGGILASGAGQDVDLIEADAAAFVLGQAHPTLQRPYRTSVYLPMIELLRYLEVHGFATYIVSGGGRDFMRAISDELYAIPRERVIGSSASLEFIDDSAGGRVVWKPAVDSIDDGPEKPVRIWSRTGRRPLIAAGNSNGDIEMLSFAHKEGRPSLRLLIHHDDADREFAYDAGAERALARAASDGWTVVSMRNEWTNIFPPQS
jgi:phosphoserine phosphatase